MRDLAFLYLDLAFLYLASGLQPPRETKHLHGRRRGPVTIRESGDAETRPRLRSVQETRLVCFPSFRGEKTSKGRAESVICFKE